jgi:hypothetical protein
MLPFINPTRLYILSCSALTTIDLPTVVGSFNGKYTFKTLPVLQMLNLPVTVGNQLVIQVCDLGHHIISSYCISLLIVCDMI